MSNLGWYQKLTTMAKRVGGPKNLMTLLVSGGVVAGVGGTLLVQKAKSLRAKRISKNLTYLYDGKTFKVVVEKSVTDRLKLAIGDKYKVLSRDGDAVLIEVLGSTDNPHFVSGDVLHKISDYEGES